MWPRHSVIYYSSPVVTAGVGLYLLYRATELDGVASVRVFLLGIVITFCAWGFTATRSAPEKRSTWARKIVRRILCLTRRVRELERTTAELRDKVDAWTAAENFLTAMERADAHRNTSWVHFRAD